VTTAPAAEVIRPPRPHRKGRWGRLVMTSVMVLLLLWFAVLLLWPGLLTGTDPVASSTEYLTAPGGAHPFGTDQLGRDVFSRVVFGAQPVLAASLGGVLLATLAGVTIGIIGGTAPRWLGGVVMRVVDVLLALPVLLVALILIATLGAGVGSIIFALGVAYTPGFARVVEASVRKLRAIEYMQAARLFGSSGLRTAVRHLLPNLATEVLVMASSAIGWAVLTATTLSFLGLGVQLPAPDWGSDLAAGATSLSTAWWLATFPGLAITVTILVANFAGDWVMALSDPRGRRFPTRLRPFRGGSDSLPSAVAVAPGEPAALASAPPTLSIPEESA
jgi:peptide/nickel transport system permease protein